MKFLIAGGAGEVGRHLMKDFTRQGHDVRIFDFEEKAKDIKQDHRITCIYGNLTDTKLVDDAVQGVDVVVNLAWSFADDPQIIFDEDIKGHINLLEAASSFKISHFIYTSTATVYGRAVVHPVTEAHPCLIGDARKPLYALGKHTAEELCQYYYQARGLSTTIFRFWWAFGDTIGGSNLRNLIRQSMRHQPLEMVHGAGGAFITMADLGRAMMLAGLNPAASGQVYNIGSLFLTWKEIGDIIISLTNSTSVIQLMSTDQWQGPAFLNEVWDLDWSKVRQALGFEPGCSTETMKSLFIEALKTCVFQVKKEEEKP